MRKTCGNCKRWDWSTKTYSTQGSCENPKRLQSSASFYIACGKDVDGCKYWQKKEVKEKK